MRVKRCNVAASVRIESDVGLTFLERKGEQGDAARIDSPRDTADAAAAPAVCTSPFKLPSSSTMQPRLRAAAIPEQLIPERLPPRRTTRRSDRIRSSPGAAATAHWCRSITTGMPAESTSSTPRSDPNM